MRYLYNPPALMKILFREFRWNTRNGKILFTFDDGPTPYSAGKILKVLDELHLKALFFCVGNNLDKNISLAEEIIKEGHAIGNHTFNHKQITKLEAGEAGKEIRSVNELLNEKLDYPVKYFRPPHGKFRLNTSRVLKEHNLTNVMWSLLTYDYIGDFELVKIISRKHLKADSIVVLHDNIRSKDIITDSIQFIADQAAEKSLEIGAPEECL